jgi:hypothetical protein
MASAGMRGVEVNVTRANGLPTSCWIQWGQAAGPANPARCPGGAPIPEACSPFTEMTEYQRSLGRIGGIWCWSSPPEVAITHIEVAAQMIKHNHAAGESVAIRSQVAGCVFRRGGSGPLPGYYDARPESLGDARSLRAKVLM